MTDDQHGNPLPDYLLPARTHEPKFTEGDLNVMREWGTPRVKALIAVIDGLRGEATLPVRVDHACPPDTVYFVDGERIVGTVANLTIEVSRG